VAEPAAGVLSLAGTPGTRELPVYAMVVGKGGLRLTPSNAADEAADSDDEAASAGRPRPAVTMGSDGFPQIPADTKMSGSFTVSLSSGEFLRIKMFGRRETIAELEDRLGSYAGRLVEDQTGLKRKYDFTLAFESEPRQPRAYPRRSRPYRTNSAHACPSLCRSNSG
jgi:uncharacterized protein (TIGR03435 family)